MGKPRAQLNDEPPPSRPTPPPVPTTIKAPRPAHVSLYIGKATQKAIKEIAIAYDMRPHDVLAQGIDMVLAHYGRGSMAKIEGKE